MDKIKMPVRYDSDAQIVWTADNVHLCDIRGYGYLTGTGGLHLSDKLADAIQDSWGRQIANALNNAADQSRVIAVLTEALGAYADRESWSEYAVGRDFRLIWQGDENEGCLLAQNALVEAQRIQEGK